LTFTAVAFADPSDAADDARLVAAAAGGDRQAFERLYRRHVGMVHGLCLRLANGRDHAEDATQETFVAAWRALARFEGRSRFSTWLHRIAVNTTLGGRRLADLPLAPDQAMQEDLVGASVSSEPPIDLERAIGALPPGARHVLVLVGIYGYSHEEVAEWLGIAVGTSKAQLHRARDLLSIRLGRETP
jgi:RNA polymerase sigma-70 factor, ECF subfamily